MKKFIYALLVIILIVIVGILIYKSSKAKTSSGTTNTGTTSNNSSVQPASLVSGDIIMKDAIATIYYGDGCPHCTNLEKWLQSSNYLPSGSSINQASVDSWIANTKVKFNMKEVWKNSTNSAELTSTATKLGLDSSSVGVPFLYDSVNNKSYIGETDIQAFFTSQTK